LGRHQHTGHVHQQCAKINGASRRMLRWMQSGKALCSDPHHCKILMDLKEKDVQDKDGDELRSGIVIKS